MDKAENEVAELRGWKASSEVARSAEADEAGKTLARAEEELKAAREELKVKLASARVKSLPIKKKILMQNFRPKRKSGRGSGSR